MLYKPWFKPLSVVCLSARNIFLVWLLIFMVILNFNKKVYGTPFHAFSMRHEEPISPDTKVGSCPWAPLIFLAISYTSVDSFNLLIRNRNISSIFDDNFFTNIIKEFTYIFNISFFCLWVFVRWKNVRITCLVGKRWRGKESVFNLFFLVDIFDSKVLNAISVNLNPCYSASIDVILGCSSFDVTKYLWRDWFLLFPSLNNRLKKYLKIMGPWIQFGLMCFLIVLMKQKSLSKIEMLMTVILSYWRLCEQERLFQ